MPKFNQNAIETDIIASLRICMILYLGFEKQILWFIVYLVKATLRYGKVTYNDYGIVTSSISTSLYTKSFFQLP